MEARAFRTYSEMQPIGFEWAPSVRWAKECEKDCVTVGRSWRWIWASRHYSDKFEVQLYRCKKRELNPYPPTKPLRRPHRNDKSEAHAIWREHSLIESVCGARLLKFPRFRACEQ